MRRPLVPLVALALALGVLLTPTSAPAAVRTASSSGAIAIPAVGLAAPYPAEAVVSGMTGLITDVDVTLHGLSHTYARDLDIVLKAPDGTNVVLMSDVCLGGLPGVTIRIDDEAPTAMPPGATCAQASYKPTNDDPSSDTMDGTAIGGQTWHTTLSQLDGRNPNGLWRLYVVDDSGNDSGQISGGFSVKVTSSDGGVAVPGNTTGAAGPASTYPLPVTVANQPGRILDVDVEIKGITHSYVDDLNLLLVGPTGRKVVLAANACGPHPIVDFSWTFDDDAPVSLTDSSLDDCYPYVVKPTAYGTPTFAAPAPAGPYAATLSAFDGTVANGTWRLYAFDDGGGDGGSLRSVKLIFRMDPPAQTTITKRPAASTTKRKATFAFTASETGATFQCKVDKKPWKACTSPLRLTKLKPGKHTVQVRAVDDRGSVDPTPAKATWRIRR